MNDFLRELTDPDVVLVHLACALLIAAMLAPTLRALRVLALASGLMALVYFGWLSVDHTGLLWAVIFVFANGTLLVMTLVRARTGLMPLEERKLIEQVLQIEEPTRQRRLLDVIEWRDVPEGQVLMEEGQLGPPLIYVASGTADVTHAGKSVGRCGEGDFLGEMSVISGARASATVTASSAMRLARFDRDALLRLSSAMPELSRAFERSLNHGLTAKVRRMNDVLAGRGE